MRGRKFVMVQTVLFVMFGFLFEAGLCGAQPPVSREAANFSQHKMRRITQQEREAAAARQAAANPALAARIAEIREGLVRARESRVTKLKEKTIAEKTVRATGRGK